eukprot:scaffold355209_cov139-Cyclotella_meneghiniana.AAC.1
MSYIDQHLAPLLPSAQYSIEFKYKSNCAVTIKHSSQNCSKLWYTKAILQSNSFQNPSPKSAPILRSKSIIEPTHHQINLHHMDQTVIRTKHVMHSYMSFYT